MIWHFLVNRSMRWALIFVLLIGTAPSRGDGPVERILFFGDSLTAGYGVEPDQAYPALIARQLRAEGWAGEVINAGLSGETTAGGLRRVDWILRQDIDIFVLALGGNDALRGIPPHVTRENLAGIVARVRTRYPDARIVLAGMQAPPNMGADYTEAFRALFPSLAESLDLTLVPFLLEGVGGVVELNLADRIHPNPAGHERLAENVWTVLAPLVLAREDS